MVLIDILNRKQITALIDERVKKEREIYNKYINELRVKIFKLEEELKIK